MGNTTRQTMLTLVRSRYRRTHRDGGGRRIGPAGPRRRHGDPADRGRSTPLRAHGYGRSAVRHRCNGATARRIALVLWTATAAWWTTELAVGFVPYGMRPDARTWASVGQLSGVTLVTVAVPNRRQPVSQRPRRRRTARSCSTRPDTAVHPAHQRRPASRRGNTA